VDPHSSQSFVSYALCSIFQDTTEVIRIRTSKKDRQHKGQKKKAEEECEDTKGVNIIRKSKKDRQHNGQKKQDNNDLQSITHKTKDRVTRIPLKIGLNPGAPEGQVVSAVLCFYVTQYITVMKSILPRQNTIKTSS